MFDKYRSTSPHVFCKNGVLDSFAKLTRTGFSVTCIGQSNFKFYASHKFSLRICAEAPNKKLTCIHIEIGQLVGGVLMSNL